MILEDSEFCASFLEKSRSALRAHQEIATTALNEAGIPISPKPYVCLLAMKICMKILAKIDPDKLASFSGLTYRNAFKGVDGRPRTA